jgi:hypothetical protein
LLLVLLFLQLLLPWRSIGLKSSPWTFIYCISGEELMINGPIPSSNACWSCCWKKESSLGRLALGWYYWAHCTYWCFPSKFGLLLTRLRIRWICSLLVFEITKSSPWNMFLLKMSGEVWSAL